VGNADDADVNDGDDDDDDDDVVDDNGALNAGKESALEKDVRDCGEPG
jgi:hypothetical protein